MVQARCIQKFRDKNNNIKGYLLEDCNGQQLRIEPDQLKNAIFMKQISVINLKLTKDGKLIDNVSEVNIHAKQAKTTVSDREIFNKLWDYLIYLKDKKETNINKANKIIYELMNAFYDVKFKSLVIDDTNSIVFYAGAIVYEVCSDYTDDKAMVLAIYNNENKNVERQLTHNLLLYDKENAYKIMCSSKANAFVKNANMINVFNEIKLAVENIKKNHSDILVKREMYRLLDETPGDVFINVYLNINLSYDNIKVFATPSFTILPSINNNKYPFMLEFSFPSEFKMEKEYDSWNEVEIEKWIDNSSYSELIQIEDSKYFVQNIHILIENAMKKAIEISKKHSN